MSSIEVRFSLIFLSYYYLMLPAGPILRWKAPFQTKSMVEFKHKQRVTLESQSHPPPH